MQAAGVKHNKHSGDLNENSLVNATLMQEKTDATPDIRSAKFTLFY